MRRSVLLLLCLVLVSLAGCGQLGPLYMPNDPHPPVYVPPPKPKPAPASASSAPAPASSSAQPGEHD